jgi:hypothetical protein
MPVCTRITTHVHLDACARVHHSIRALSSREGVNDSLRGQESMPGTNIYVIRSDVAVKVGLVR